MPRPRRPDDPTAGLLAALAPRAKSLIVTIFGDAIVPHGGTVWLGSLIRLVEPLGLNERIVRTVVFRLVKDDWLCATQIGRRSYYGPTDSGRHRFDAVEPRIYAPPRRDWDGGWQLLFTSGIAGGLRERLKRELAWLGFGAIAPTVLGHPAGDEKGVRQILADLGVADRVVLMRANQDRWDSLAACRDLVRGIWDLDRLAADYAGFLERFRPVWRTLTADEAPDPAACFTIRMLLMHDFRRVLLRDPMLPEALLPPTWPGLAAQTLCRNLYRLTFEPAERHLMGVLENADGPLPEAAPYVYGRFGGLTAVKEVYVQAT